MFASDAHTRAIKKTMADHYSIRSHIPPSISNWRADEAVSAFLRRIREGTLRPEVPDDLVEEFYDRSTLPAITLEKAREICQTFVVHLQEERYKDDDGRALLANTTRTEVDRVLTEIRERSTHLSQARFDSAAPQNVQSDVASLELEGGGSVSSQSTAEASSHRTLDTIRDMVNEGAPKSALRLLKKLRKELSKDVSDEVRYRIEMNSGACRMMLGDMDAAADSFRAALESKPADLKALQQAAQAELHRGSAELARKYMTEALALDANASTAWAVRVQLEPGIEPPPEVRDERAVLMAQGMVALGQERASDAVGFFRTALEQAPDDPQLKILLADALSQLSEEGG